jgi:hypothetical protein
MRPRRFAMAKLNVLNQGAAKTNEQNEGIMVWKRRLNAVFCWPEAGFRQ